MFNVIWLYQFLRILPLITWTFSLTWNARSLEFGAVTEVVEKDLYCIFETVAEDSVNLNHPLVP